MKKKLKHTTSLRTRMIELFVIVIIATLLITGSFSYSQTKRIINQYQMNIADNLLERVTLDLNSKLERAVEITEQLLYFPSISEVVMENESATSTSQIKSYQSIVTFLRVLEEQLGYERVRIFARNIGNSFLQDGIRLFPYSSLEKELPIDSSVTNRTEQVRFIDSYGTTFNGYTSSPQISVVRLVVDGSERRTTAAVSLDFNCSGLLSGWNTSNNDDHSFYLINKEGQILSNSDSTQTNQTIIPKELTEKLYHNRLLQTEGKNYLTRHVGNSDWLMVMSVSDDFVQDGIWSIFYLNVLIILVACLVATAAVIVISKTLTGRLTALTKTLQFGAKQTSLPNALSLHMEEIRGECTETAVLVRSYNDMLERIRLLGEENTRIAVRENRYRMEALRLQINSHFLYNTLASIKGYIEINEVNAASQLLMELADFFKYSLGGKSVCISLREELQLIRCYLHIQQIVYDNAFSYELEIPDKFMDISIPKFLLQPIVENAVVHGVSEVYEEGIVRLSGSEDEKTIYIRIEDNGPGFREEMLEGQLTGDPEKYCTGIGMRNVMVRLKLYFGQDAQIRIENLPCGGGRVTLELPKEGISNMLFEEECEK